MERLEEMREMPDQLTIKAQVREVTGKHVSRLRAQGITPANISGAAKPSVAIQLATVELNRLLKNHGTGVLRIQITPGSSNETAILSRVERDAVSTAVLHVDFR